MFSFLFLMNRTSNQGGNRGSQSVASSVFSQETPGLDNQTIKAVGTQMSTMVRDKLCINPEESLSIGETPALYRDYRKQLQTSLRDSFNALPEPKNDYEIIVPNDIENVNEENKATTNDIEDQTDVDARNAIENELKLQRLLKKRSQVIQRSLPRPLGINTNIFRYDDGNLTQLQIAEEQIKHEMITMLLYDAKKNPVEGSAEFRDEIENITGHKYVGIPQADLEKAKEMLADEVKVVKEGMGHGDISLDVYVQVWEECFGQVIYLPSQNRYTRAHLTTKKDRLESYEKRLDQNRFHMANEAKRCSKMEKRLKILTNGYLARVQAITKALHYTDEQIEQNYITLETFQKLTDQEMISMPRRLVVSTLQICE